MDPLTSIGLVLWTLISLGLTLNVLHPLINRDRARPLSQIFGFGPKPEDLAERPGPVAVDQWMEDI